MRPQIPNFRKGEHLTAEKMQILLDELRRMCRLSVTQPLELFWGASGPTISLRREVAPQLLSVKLTARTPITNPGWGASPLTGIFDWVEMMLREDGVWITRSHGRTGSYALGTGCVEMQFTNHALEYGTKIVYLEPLDPDNDSISRSEGGGWAYLFDEAHTNII